MSGGQKLEVELLDHVFVYETTFLLEWMKDPWKDIELSGKWLLNLAKEVQPDIIHLNCYSYASLHWKVPCIVVAHSDVFSWFVAVKSEAPPAEWTEYISYVRNGLQGADLVIAPSGSMLRFIRQLYITDINSRVIYNGRSKALFYNRKKEPYIFTMGRVWDEGKNIQLIVNCASQISCEVRVAGDNTFEEDKINLNQQNIRYLGKLGTTEIAEQLAGASVYVLPAKYEPFGLSALEAALSGCALVLGDIDSLKEIWGDNAMYVDTNNALALADTINTLMSNSDLLSEYSDKAYQHAQQYSALSMGTQYFESYHSLMRQHGYLKTRIA